jgi:hypothetical protein
MAGEGEPLPATIAAPDVAMEVPAAASQAESSAPAATTPEAEPVVMIVAGRKLTDKDIRLWVAIFAALHISVIAPCDEMRVPYQELWVLAPCPVPLSYLKFDLPLPNAILAIRSLL